MSVIMMISLCACAKATPSTEIEGTWRCDIDVTEVMNSTLAESLGVEEIESDVTLIFPLELTFNADQSCYFKYDQEAITDSFTVYLEWLTDWVVDYMMDQMVAETGFTPDVIDAFIESEYGMSFEDYVKAIMDQNIDLDALFNDSTMETSGYYVLNDNKIYLGHTLNGIDAEGDNYISYAIDEDTLSFIDFAGDLDVFWDDVSDYATLPLDFIKQQ